MEIWRSQLRLGMSQCRPFEEKGMFVILVPSILGCAWVPIASWHCHGPKSEQTISIWVCHLSKWRRGGELQLTSKETRETTSIITEFNIGRGCNYTNQIKSRTFEIRGYGDYGDVFSQLVTGLESNHVQSIFPARLVLKCQRLEGPETFVESMRANGTCGWHPVVLRIFLEDVHVLRECAK